MYKRQVQEADAIYREEIAKAGIDRNIGQYFAALTNMRSVGVMGDERTYDYAIALRAVNTIDFMTAEAAEIPWEVLGTVASRIVNEVPHVNRILYDLSLIHISLPERTKIQLLAPMVRGRKGRHEKVLEQAKRSGYVRVMIDGNLHELSEEITLEKNIKHNIEIVVDRLVVKSGIEKRLTDSIETVMKLSDGLMIVDVADGEPINFSPVSYTHLDVYKRQILGSRILREMC